MSTQPVAPIPVEPLSMIKARKNIARIRDGRESPNLITDSPKRANADAPTILLAASRHFLILVAENSEGPRICGTEKLSCTIAGTIPTNTVESVRWLTNTGRMVTADTRLIAVKKIRLLPNNSA